MLQQTSIDAYNHMVETGKINTRQKQILDILKDSHCPLTNADISFQTHLPINCVTPRVKELRTNGYVVQAGKTIDPVTGRRANTWKVKDA